MRKGRKEIASVISKVTKLTASKEKESDFLTGNCPICKSEGALMVYKSAFHCFGCGASGDVYDFIMHFGNLDFLNAAKIASRQYPIPEPQNSKLLYEINEAAASFYYKQLTKQETPGLLYAIQRGLDPKTIKEFRIGYASDSWDSLTKMLIENGYHGNDLVRAGISAYNPKKHTYYDRMRNRLMFPIRNHHGHIVGFGGRLIPGAEGAKYINTVETDVFSKKNILFGLDKTKQYIKQQQCCIVVEGQMDFLALYKRGIRNVVATLGTALTHEHAIMLRKIAKTVVLAYDSDAAGQRAAERGSAMLREKKVNVRILSIPDGKDPDEFLQSHSVEEFQKMVVNAIPYVDYRIDILKKRDAKPMDLVKALRNI